MSLDVDTDLTRLEQIVPGFGKFVGYPPRGGGTASPSFRGKRA